MANSADSAGLAKLIVNGSMGNFGIGGSLMVKNPENANTANAYIEIGENASFAAGRVFYIKGTDYGDPSFTSVDDFTGTVVKWNLAEDGSSGMISANGVSAFECYLVLDFSNVDLSAGASASSTIAKVDDGGIYGDYIIYAFINDSYVELNKGGETVIGDVTIDLSSFVTASSELSYSFSVAAVPEPATCAAVFGALALAFAAYRRRG